MKKKVLVGYIIAAMIALVAFEYAFWTNGFSYLVPQSEKSYLTQAEMLRDLFQAEKVAGKTVTSSSRKITRKPTISGSPL